MISYTPEQLVRIQLELECIGIADSRTLIRIPGREPDAIARFYTFRSGDKYSAFFRAGLPAQARVKLIELGPETCFHEEEKVMPLLAPHAPCSNVSRFSTYIFSDSLSESDHPEALLLTGAHWRLIRRYDAKINPEQHTTCALILGDRIVSTCESARENERAAEAWVRTIPRFRGRGYARQVTAAWGRYLQQQGKIPFYSHRPDNTASRALARSLGLVHVFDGVAYE